MGIFDTIGRAFATAFTFGLYNPGPSKADMIAFGNNKAKELGFKNTAAYENWLNKRGLKLPSNWNETPRFNNSDVRP